MTDRAVLPQARTSLLGRESLLADVIDVLTYARLVTLTGPGGAGKTRVAVAVAEAMESRFREGIRFVDLTGAQPGGGDVSRVVERALRSSPDGPASLVDLSGQHSLLILDNCEHVIDDAAELADDLLGRAPDVVVLATSREALAIQGEHRVVVPTLPAEDRSDPAVALFLERAHQWKPDLTIDDTARWTAFEIARRLDGLPLAIELAAARTRSLTLTEVLDQLDDRFRLLTRGARGGRPQHRTLLETLAWSYDLLSPEEQRALRRLSAFGGAISLHTAAAALEADRSEAADLLDSLVEKSLVVPISTRGHGGYRMLETIREYGRHLLDETDEADEALRAAERALLPPEADRTDWRTLLNDHLGANAERSALETDTRHLAALAAVAGGRIEEAVLLTSTGAVVDGAMATPLRELLRTIDDRDVDPLIRCAAAVTETDVLAEETDFIGLLERCTQMIESLPPGHPAIIEFQSWGIALTTAAAPRLGVEQCEELLPVVRAAALPPHDHTLSEMLNSHATGHVALGDLDRGLEVALEALAWSRPDGNTRNQAIASSFWLHYLTDTPPDPELLAASDRQDETLGLAHLSLAPEVLCRPEPIADRAAALADAVEAGYQPIAAPSLLAYAALASESGDDERATTLLDAVELYEASTQIGLLGITARVERWPDDEWESAMAPVVERTMARSTLPFRAQAMRVLEAEVEQWRRDLAFRSASGASADTGDLSIAVLGPLVVSIDGAETARLPPKQRAIVTALALAGGDRVDVQGLVDAAWGDDPPRSAVGSLRSQISRLRTALGNARLQGDTATGYSLTVERSSVDALAFVDAVERSAAVPVDERVEILTNALGCWRGTPLIDLADTSEAGSQGVGLIERRLHAEEELVAALLDAGRSSDAVAESERLVETDPLRERRWTLHIDGLVATGRVAEALRAYQRARTLLLDELGIEPGVALRAAEARALAAGS